MISWAVPASAVPGFYALVVNASYQYGTFGGLAVKGFEISQGLQNTQNQIASVETTMQSNQNQIMTSLGGLSAQLASFQSYVLSGQSQIMTQIASTETLMLANQNQVMTAIGGLSTQLASFETYVLEGQSQIMTQISSVGTTMQSNQNQVMTGIGGLSAQLSSVETNILITLLNSTAKAAAPAVVVTSALLGAYLLPSSVPGATSQAFGFALLALITVAALLSTSVLLRRQRK